MSLWVGRLARMVSRVLTLAVVVLMTHAHVSADSKGPVIPKGKGDACVAETDFMRRNHMDLIVHQRDETVIKGIRSEPFSLVECVNCHVQKDENNEFIRVDAEEQFCASCHSFVAAKIDCFGCHAAVPDKAFDAKGSATEKLGTRNWRPSIRSQMLVSHSQMQSSLRDQTSKSSPHSKEFSLFEQVDNETRR